MTTPLSSSKRLVGAIVHSPSAQMCGQYDELHGLDEYEFELLFRNRAQDNPAWTPVLPERVGYHFLEPDERPWIPQSLRHRFNCPITPLLNERNYDGIIIHGIWDSSAVREAVRWCRKRGRPYLIRTDANLRDETKWWRRVALRFLVARRVQGAAALLTIGDQNEAYYRHFGAKNHNMFHAPWEIDYEALESILADIQQSPAAARYPQKNATETFSLIAVARLLQRKGLETVFDAMRTVQNSGRQIEMQVAGDGPYRPQLEAAVQDKQINVTFLGNVDRAGVVKQMCDADAFVLASTREPWGLVVNEACLCGKPLLLSRAVGAAADLLIENENGFDFEPGNAGELAKKLCKLIDDPALVAKMARRSREIIEHWRRQHRAADGYRRALDFSFGKN